MPYGPSNTPPFARGPYLFAHNGFVQDFRRALMRTLRAALCDELYSSIEGGTDSEHLFALFLQHLRGRESKGPGALQEALAATVRQVDRWVRERGLEAQLNMVATDGTALVASRHATGARAPSLYVHAGRGTRGCWWPPSPCSPARRGRWCRRGACCW
jgi:glutamine amidotransferase